MPQPPLPAPLAPRPEPGAQLLEAVRQRQAELSLQLAQHWVHRRGVIDLQRFCDRDLGPAEGPEAVAWLQGLLGLEGPIPAAAAASSSSPPGSPAPEMAPFQRPDAGLLAVAPIADEPGEESDTTHAAAAPDDKPDGQSDAAMPAEMGFEPPQLPDLQALDSDLQARAVAAVDEAFAALAQSFEEAARLMAPQPAQPGSSVSLPSFSSEPPAAPTAAPEPMPVRMGLWPSLRASAASLGSMLRPATGQPVSPGEAPQPSTPAGALPGAATSSSEAPLRSIPVQPPALPLIQTAPPAEAETLEASGTTAASESAEAGAAVVSEVDLGNAAALLAAAPTAADPVGAQTVAGSSLPAAVLTSGASAALATERLATETLATEAESTEAEATTAEATDLEAIDLRTTDLEATDLEALDLKSTDLEGADADTIDAAGVPAEAEALPPAAEASDSLTLPAEEPAATDALNETQRPGLLRRLRRRLASGRLARLRSVMRDCVDETLALLRSPAPVISEDDPGFAAVVLPPDQPTPPEALAAPPGPDAAEGLTPERQAPSWSLEPLPSQAVAPAASEAVSPLPPSLQPQPLRQAATGLSWSLQPDAAPDSGKTEAALEPLQPAPSAQPRRKATTSPSWSLPAPQPPAAPPAADKAPAAADPLEPSAEPAPRLVPLATVRSIAVPRPVLEAEEGPSAPLPAPAPVVPLKPPVRSRSLFSERPAPAPSALSDLRAWLPDRHDDLPRAS